jgi:hypothetical protein
MNRKERKDKLRGKHSATNEAAPTVPTRRAPFTKRTSIPTPLYDQIVNKLKIDPLKDRTGIKRVDIMKGIRYKDTRVPIYGVNAQYPWEKPDEEM